MSKDNNDDDKKGYEIGYGKPPKGTRFGKVGGNPINRKGAPSKAEKLMQDRFSHDAMRRSFLDAGKEMVTMNDPNGGKIRISKMDALPKTVLNEALKGNMRAFDLYMRYTDRYAKDQDKALLELYDVSSRVEEDRFQASLDPGSRKHYEAMHNYFMLRRTMRKMEGADLWPYLDDEPITPKDWQVFMEYYESFSTNKFDTRAWPPPYPSVLEEQKYDNMSKTESLQNHLKTFQHRKEMRVKEGLRKWPILIEEPVDDEDWQHFTQHIQDRLDAKDNPAPWPPAYWDDDPEE
jgi:hypothetical protein